MPELAVLSADSMIEFALKGVLMRERSLGIRSVSFSAWTHPERDPGCLQRSHDFLRPFAGTYERAIVVFDRDGCGSDAQREDLEAEVEGRLDANGWAERAAVIVIEPELESWAWSDSPHVPRILGWNVDQELRPWLQDRGLWPAEVAKPPDPKKALEVVLRQVRKPHSASLFQSLARRVSLNRCVDPSFAKLRTVLEEWFPLQ